MIEEHPLLTTDELLDWVNADGRLLKPITYPRLTFWLQSRRVPPERKTEGRNLYAVETAQQLAELIRAHQLLKSTIKWRPNRGVRARLQANAVGSGNGRG